MKDARGHGSNKKGVFGSPKLKDKRRDGPPGTWNAERQAAARLRVEGPLPLKVHEARLLGDLGNPQLGETRAAIARVMGVKRKHGGHAQKIHFLKQHEAALVRLHQADMIRYRNAKRNGVG